MRTPFYTIVTTPFAKRPGWRHPWVEASIWLAGIVLMASADPSAPSLLDLCLFKAIGLPGCPGCGLGHALGYLFRGEWALAIESHRLSPFVLGVLLARTAGLVRQGFSRT